MKISVLMKQVVRRSIGMGLAFVTISFNSGLSAETAGSAQKLYWFIPDGMRADPDVFNVFEWARQGKLPNIKKMMDNGSYGYCIPVFPSHTPVNFATLVTGAYPKTHGVADGPMHIEGRPLDKVAVGGFSSVAKKVPPIWVTLEEQGKNVVLLSMPGSTPPELEKGTTIRGRWGGWGADFHPLIFQSKGDMADRKKQGRGARLFFFGPELTRYIETKPATGWSNVPKSYSQPLEAEMNGWGCPIFMYFFDGKKDSTKNYDSIAVSLDKKTILAVLSTQSWSGWFPLTLQWQEQSVASHARIKVIKLNYDPKKGELFFRIRCLYDTLNRHIVKPAAVADEIVDGVGPMVDFVDNFPAQLVYYDEDKPTFLEEAAMTFDWHQRATDFMLKRYKPDVYIHDPYTPNQMLSSRWWMGYIDPMSIRYKEVSESERKKLWSEVLDMYKKIDAIVGVYLKHADKNTLVVLSSDHGMAALNSSVHLNNLFAKEGLLSFTIDSKTGEPVIDWQKTKVIYLKMDNIYINPAGLAGNYQRSKGPEYEALREKVIDLLNSLRDDGGRKVVATVVRWEDVVKTLDLPIDRVGDLIVANELGFGWSEEMSSDLTVFSTPLISGYKQAIMPRNEKAMLTPFIIMGPGVKKNHYIEKPIVQVDQYPTIMKLLGVSIPSFVEGRSCEEIHEKKR